MPFKPPGLDNPLFRIAPILFTGAIILFASLILKRIVKELQLWHQNNQCPVQTVEVIVAAKWIDEVRYTEPGTHHETISTFYYVLFEAEDSSSIEFGVREREYDMFTEGEKGQLTFQGTRYQGFEKISKTF